MAQKTVIQFIDDLDGTTRDNVETVTFGLDGVVYEIDLSDANAASLRDGLAEFVESARRTGGRAKRAVAPVAVAGRVNGRSREQTQAIREWAKKNGHDVADRGRIPAMVIEAFEAGAGTGKATKKKAR